MTLEDAAERLAALLRELAEAGVAVTVGHDDGPIILTWEPTAVGGLASLARWAEVSDYPNGRWEAR